MSDLISRQAVLDYIDSMPSELTNDGRRMIRRIRLTEYISDTLPSAQRKGKWILDGKAFVGGVDWLHCSECGYKDINLPDMRANFCPNCGADMRGEEE